MARRPVSGAARSRVPRSLGAAIAPPGGEAKPTLCGGIESESEIADEIVGLTRAVHRMDLVRAARRKTKRCRSGWGIHLSACALCTRHCAR